MSEKSAAEMTVHEAAATLRTALTRAQFMLGVLEERLALRAEIIRDAVQWLDPECPDAGAYVDGHCSLGTAAQRAVQCNTITGVSFYEDCQKAGISSVTGCAISKFADGTWKVEGGRQLPPLSPQELWLLKEARDTWDDPEDRCHAAVFYRLVRAAYAVTEEMLDAAVAPVQEPRPDPVLARLEALQQRVDALSAELRGKGGDRV